MEGWQGSDRASGDHSVLGGEREKKGKGAQGSGREGPGPHWGNFTAFTQAP